MATIKTWTKRIVMIILFTIALFVTYQTVTGVHAQGISGGKPELKGTANRTGKIANSLHSYKSLEIGYKSLKIKEKETTKISSSEEIQGRVPKLEDAFDWEKAYPRENSGCNRLYSRI